jgi:hypothetical protein
MDVHNPYAPPEPYDTMFAPQQPGKVVYANGPASPSQADLEWSIGQYDGDIRAFDGLLEQLLTRWERPGATARRPRITIVLSDHGEEFMEHGGLGHGTTVFREQARIALLLKATSVVPGISGSPVQMIDVSRAVLDFAGAAVPHHFQGRPVALWGQPVSIYTEALHGLFALRCNQLMTTQVSGKPDSLRVYNTLTDPGEQRPGTMFGATSEQQAAVARFCFDEFGAGDEALADSLGGPMTIQMDPATRDALKGLGYLGQ